MAGITGNLDPPDADSPTGGGTSYFIRRAFDHPYCCYMLCHRHNGPILPVVAILNFFLIQDLSYQPPVDLPLHGMVPITKEALMDMFSGYTRELVKHIRTDLPPAVYLLDKAKWDALPRRGDELFRPTDVKPIHTQSTKNFHGGLHTDLCETVAISLHHGWLVDPKESAICHSIRESTYAELPHDLQNVLDVWSDQITPYGMSCLSSCIEDDRNFLLLRNDSHASGTLYELVTNELYCRTYNAMWKTLNLDAAEVFFTADLCPLPLVQQPHKMVSENPLIEWFEKYHGGEKKSEEEAKEREEDAKKREEENLQSFLEGTNIPRKSDSNKPANVKRGKQCRNRKKANKTDVQKMKEENYGSGTKTPAKPQGSKKCRPRGKKTAMPRKEEHNEREQSNAIEISLGGCTVVSSSGSTKASKSESFVEYVVDNNLFEPYVLYDGTRINITSSAGRKVGRGYVSFVVRMHRRNLSWNGDFKLSDLLFKDGEFVILKPAMNDATRPCVVADLDTLLKLLNEYFGTEEPGGLPAYFDLLGTDCTLNMPDPKSEARETEVFRRYLEHHLAFKSPEARSALFRSMHKMCKAHRTVDEHDCLVYQPLNHSPQFDWRRDIRNLAATEIFKKVYDGKDHMGVKYMNGSFWQFLRYVRYFDEHMMGYTEVDGKQQVDDIIQMDLILGLHFGHYVGRLVLEMMHVLTEKKFLRIWSLYETSECRAKKREASE